MNRTLTTLVASAAISLASGFPAYAQHQVAREPTSQPSAATSQPTVEYALRTTGRDGNKQITSQDIPFNIVPTKIGDHSYVGVEISDTAGISQRAGRTTGLYLVGNLTNPKPDEAFLVYDLNRNTATLDSNEIRILSPAMSNGNRITIIYLDPQRITSTRQTNSVLTQDSQQWNLPIVTINGTDYIIANIPEDKENLITAKSFDKYFLIPTEGTIFETTNPPRLVNKKEGVLILERFEKSRLEEAIRIRANIVHEEEFKSKKEARREEARREEARNRETPLQTSEFK